jgi:beta-glucanase (GH16 family)
MRKIFPVFIIPLIFLLHAGPSGISLPLGDIPGWRQIFSDDFTTDVPLGSFPDAVATKWSAYPDGWKDTSKKGTYYPSQTVTINGGTLNIFLHTENSMHMVCAPVPKLPGAVGNGTGLQYGRYAICFRADAVPGYKTAWLLWPDSEVWPRDGEIDFPEGNLTGTISAFMHRQNGTSGSDQDAFSSQATYTQWHVAVIEWTSPYVDFLLDGASIGRSVNRIPNTPMHWVIQTETTLSGETSDTAQGTVQIDWVAVYAPAQAAVEPKIERARYQTGISNNRTSLYTCKGEYLGFSKSAATHILPVGAYVAVCGRASSIAFIDQ